MPYALIQAVNVMDAYLSSGPHCNRQKRMTKNLLETCADLVSRASPAAYGC